MNPSLRSHRKLAFSLVEVVIALGIFIFCVVSIVYLLGMALVSSRESQQQSSVAAALRSVESSLRSIPIANLKNLAATNFYFDLSGNSLTNSASSDLYFRARVQRAEPSASAASMGVANTDHYFVWLVDVAYPAPSFAESNHFVLGSASYEP